MIALLGLVVVEQPSARSLNVDEPCATDAQRVDFASTIFCIPKSNNLYRYKVDSFIGLQFWPQAFIGDRRVSPETFYDADGNGPADGTYVYVKIKHEWNGGRTDANRQALLIRDLNEAFHARAGELAFAEKIGGRSYGFERRDSSTIVATSTLNSLSEPMQEIWVRVDAENRIRHVMVCSRSQSVNDLVGCTSRFPVGNSSGGIVLYGGTPARSFRISGEIRETVESFVLPR